MARSMLLALGGNAILPHGKSGTIREQRENVPPERLVALHWAQFGGVAAG